MKHKVYLRDWYYNAGIIGFLNIIANDEDIDFNNIQSLTVGENYIEFDNNIFDDFEEKFKRYAFLKFFNIQAYLSRFKKNQNSSLDLKLQNFIDSEKIESYTKKQIYKILNSNTEGEKWVKDFINLKFKGICEYSKISEYINKIKSIKQSKDIKTDDLCLSCQERKSEYEFNNNVSNIIGFNKDNSNWIWGFKPSKLKICPVCAIIYSCAFASFAYVLKKTDKKYLNFFYFPNENVDVKTLFNTVRMFNLMLDNIQNTSNLFYVMIKQTVEHISKRQLQNIVENINFIEIVENPMLSGQSTKGYNIYNFNINSDIAQFLNLQFVNDSIPKGYYVIKDTYYSIEEELLKLIMQRQLSYSNLHKYFSYSLASEKYSANYNINKIVRFVFKYIQWIRGDNMKKSEKIINKGFTSGINLRNELLRKNKENQINGLVYGFLNDLKVADREKFLDKYVRVMMSHNQPNLFGKDEMLDDDYFLQFGYSFVTGLMSKEKNTEINNFIKEGNNEGE